MNQSQFKKAKEKIKADPSNQEKFENWMRDVVQNVHRANFNKMDRAMSSIKN